MFNSYDMNRALVSERQNQLLGDARRHRLARIARKARQANPEERSVRALSGADPIARAADLPYGHEERLAA